MHSHRWHRRRSSGRDVGFVFRAQSDRLLHLSLNSHKSLSFLACYIYWYRINWRYANRCYVELFGRCRVVWRFVASTTWQTAARRLMIASDVFVLGNSAKATSAAFVCVSWTHIPQSYLSFWNPQVDIFLKFFYDLHYLNWLYIYIYKVSVNLCNTAPARFSYNVTK